MKHFHQDAADFRWALHLADRMLARQNPYDTPLEQYPLTAGVFALLASVVVLVENGLSLTDLPRLLTDRDFRNGALTREHNSFILALLEHCRRGRPGLNPLGMVAGSDSHTLRRVGRTFTASPARNREEFLRDIRAGRTQVFGPHTNHLAIAADIYGVVLRYYPTVLSVTNGEFPPLARLKNVFLSVLTVPFLFMPYVAAVRYTTTDRRRVILFSRLFLGEQFPLALA